MPTVLSSPFFFIINCLFTCFDRISALSVKSGCLLRAVRGTRNFGIILISSGNRHIFTSMFKCASLVHPCTSVACCQTKFPVPLAGVMWHLLSTDSAAIQSKQLERQFICKKNTHCKNCWHFISDKENPL